MGEIEREARGSYGAEGSVEYDLADAIYAACLVDSLRSDSPFYFMDAEDGHTSMLAWVA